MWEQSLCESAAHAHGRASVSLSASAAADAALLAAAILLPLTHTAWMQRLAPVVPLAAPLSLEAAPPAPAPTTTWHSLLLFSVPNVPLTPLPVATRPVPMAPPAAWTPGAVTDSLPLTFTMRGVPAPPVPVDVAHPAPPPPPIREGGEVMAAMCVSCPAPVYPPFARQARIEGTVILHALISPDGRVIHLQLVSGGAVLAAAAEEAVRAWRYHPLRLDGRAVPVDSDITVRFTLN